MRVKKLKMRKRWLEINEGRKTGKGGGWKRIWKDEN